MSFEEVAPLSPMSFFSMGWIVPRAMKLPKKLRDYTLPDTSALLDEEPFAQLAMAWHENGLTFRLESDYPFRQAFYPKYKQGDALELFIDTRDVKSSGFLTKFCHHFVILPSEVQGVHAQEVTRLRADDARALADGSEIAIKADHHSSGYTLDIHIPAHCLHGFDPRSFKRLGFSYRIHRHRGRPQHFTASGRHFAFERQSALWASLKLGDTP